MKRLFHSPWFVALAVLALAALPVLAALASHREQARRAEALLFERSADVVAGQLRLLTLRRMSWQNSVRMRLSNRPDALETQLDELLAPGSWISQMETSRVLAYGSLEDRRVVLRWQRVKTGPPLGRLGDDLLALAQTATLVRNSMAKPAQTASVQNGGSMVTAMTVSPSSPHEPRGWVLGVWDLGAMCSDAQIRLVQTDYTLTVRPLDGAPAADELVMDIGEGDARWRAAVGKGGKFGVLFPQVSERAIALTGGGCALLLALLAGFATRAAGLRAALAGEREVVRMKDHLLHSVSHEFRTPLSVILSSTELLESYAERLAPERRAEALAQIRDSTSRMNDMIGQVLLLSRIEASRMPVEPRVLDVAAFARELAREIETATHARCPIQVTAPDKFEATLDPALLRAVLGNLLSNAAKFSSGAQPVEFTVERGDTLRFIIRDRGPGIDAADLRRVREPFFRSASAGGIPGTGLGLTIADKCAALLGGTLAIASDTTGTTGTTGTTATLTL